MCIRDSVRPVSFFPGKLQDMGKGKALMAQQFKPRLHQFFVELVQRPFILYFIKKGKGIYEHPRTLLKFIAGTVENKMCIRDSS